MFGFTSGTVLRTAAPVGCWSAPICVDSELYGFLSFPVSTALALDSEEQLLLELLGTSIARVVLEDRLRCDHLTRLPNRFRLLALLDQCLGRAQETGGMVGVLFVDLDRFKQINDSLGHAAGDRVLIEVAGRLTSCLGPADVAGRMGGDEFTVLLPGTDSQEAALQRAREFLAALQGSYLIDGRELFVTASIGMSLYPKHGTDAAALLQAADAAMYRAKKTGTNALEFFESGAGQGSLAQFDLENALRRALEKGEFELLYQPIFGMAGSLEGMEALLSWNHATRGKVGASEFIPMAEATGLIVPIGDWVLHQACSAGARWNAAGLRLERIAVNVSALQFAKPDFVGSVANALASAGFPARLLQLELTESLVLRDIGESIQRMTQLRELGVSIAIDDFGSGYSSLNYLRRLPVNELKIDQSFLRDLRGQPCTLSVVQTIVALAHTMKLTVIAEGVETEEELELLRQAGCDKVQGHLFGASLHQNEMEELLVRSAKQRKLHA